MPGQYGIEPTGVVFDIQRYSLGDGPGIRTTVFLKGCPLRCRWCQNPESFRPEPEIAFRGERCIDCGACSRACPRGAILACGAQRVDPARCDTCGACVQACPTTALFSIGRRYTVSGLLSEVQRDAVFYGESGGGVTLSGGEPALQSRFVQAFLLACKRAGLDTAIETSGSVPRERLAELLPLLDRLYLDLKTVSPEDHLRLTGVSNDLILDNARWLSRSGAPVTFRVPLVPGMTSTAANIEALASLLQALGAMEVEVCPYHDNWERKLAWLPTSQRPLGLPGLAPEETRAIVGAFAVRGIAARVLG